MINKILDCTYCKGRGWNYTDLMYQKDCAECGGTGKKTIKETEKQVEKLRNLGVNVEFSVQE